ncbi:MAG: thiopeptide-type bacteriocin biosynthesis protein [Bacteroidales bacterium]|nr:thiopeptide-type bacteriocin biosynthesis protein [Bacteroidales bacterium]
MKQIYIPGEEWVSLKLYMGELFANDFLVNDLFPLIEEFKNKELIEKWYFLRYRDPKFHLRIRIKLTDANDYGQIIKDIKILLREYIDKGIIWDIQFGNYTRELERYGIESIELVESIFSLNSELAIFLLGTIENSKFNDFAWRFTTKYIDQILNTCGFSNEMKLTFLTGIRDYFETEFNIKDEQQHQIKQKYRSYRKDIEFFMSASVENIFPDPEMKNTVEKYFNHLEKLLSELIVKLKIDKNVPLSGIIHMHFNRFFDNEPRRYELMIYSFLTIYYNSELKKTVYKEKNKYKHEKNNCNS